MALAPIPGPSPWERRQSRLKRGPPQLAVPRGFGPGEAIRSGLGSRRAQRAIRRLSPAKALSQGCERDVGEAGLRAQDLLRASAKPDSTDSFSLEVTS